MERRKFIYNGAILGAGAMMIPNVAMGMIADDFPTKRPTPAKRKFTSKAVENLITDITNNIKDKEIAWLFANCYPNTLDTTVNYSIINGKPDTYIITGDIDAMWLRDSSAQVNAYILLCKYDQELSNIVEGLIRRQARCIQLDPYANAFYKDNHKISEWRSDLTDMKPGVHERKWELDSLCYCIRLAYNYWKSSGNAAPFDTEWLAAMKLVISTMKDQQRKTDKGKYKFQRNTETQSDTLPGAGYGNPCKPTGMICSTFRNSDDAALYLYNIPENLFAVITLRQLADILNSLKLDVNLAADVLALAHEVEQAVLKYGTVEHPTFGKIYAYECDGYGNYVMMEDAGVPGLISIPYLGYGGINDELYLNTRKFALSDSNPYFFKGTAAEGTGSPHLAYKDSMIWPMGIIMRGLTTNNVDEIKLCLQMLKKTHADTGFMHEGFNCNNPNDYTRKWFAWVNNLFGELIIKVYNTHKELLD